MFIKKDKVTSIQERTFEEYAKYRSLVNEELMDEYKALLKGIAEKGEYQEGEMITDGDLASINKSVKKILEDVKKNIIANGESMQKNEKMSYDCVTPMIAMTDYMFVTAMETLGCPYIPNSFGPEIHEALEHQAKQADAQLKKAEYTSISSEEHYNDQRKKDADVVRANNSELIRTVKQKKASPEKVATLLAEYQALKQRQNNHTFLWKMFHGDENKARNTLLSDMEKALKVVLGNNVYLDKISPVKVAVNMEDKIINGQLEKELKETALMERHSLPYQCFVYGAKSTERAAAYRESHNLLVNKEDKNVRTNVDFKENEFGAKVDEKNVEPKAVEAPAKNEISKNV